jgi:molybdopterin-synthase adenylyltransferase
MPENIRQKLPAGELSKEVHLGCEANRWYGIEDRLKRDAPNEACVFALARPSRGSIRTTIILGEPIWPLAGEVKATPYSLEISADYISRSTDAAIDAGGLTGIVLIHTHPPTARGKGRGRFSARDDWYEARLFPTITLGRPTAISGSVVLGTDPHDLDARIWWNTGGGLKTQPVHVVRVVGPEITFIETPHSGWRDHPDPAIMDRSTRLWGIEGRRKLQNVRVGIVGAGGTGSIVLLSTATMGVGKIRVWDKDIVKKENLHRTLGATRQMLGSPKVEALAGVARLVATAEPFEIEPIVGWGTSAEGLRGLKDCDVIFCCVDKFAPRVPLNDLAYAHLIPTVDMASWIHAANGKVDAIMTHAHVWSPGIPCAWCRQTLTSMRLTREAQGNQRNIENLALYGLPLEATDDAEPSVLPLNLTGVGLALLEFMQVALKVTTRTPRDLKLFLPEWELDESDLESLPDCKTELAIGLGDAVRIAPVSEEQ